MPMRMSGVAAPAAMGIKTRVGAPQINRGKTFCVKHTEYLDDLSAHNDFFIDEDQIYSLNPGRAIDFPWLSSIAQNFEQYRFKRLQFRYMTRASTSASGTVYMSTQLNPADSNFADKQEMYSYTGTTSNMVWSSNTHNCLLKRSDPYKKYFVRVGDLASGQDIQLYDQGKFSWVMIGPTTGVLGELLVDYEVEFFNPKRSPASMPGSAFLAGIMDQKTDPVAFLTPYAPANAVPGSQTNFSSFGASQDVLPKPDGDWGPFPPGVYQITVDMLQVGASDLEVTNSPVPYQSQPIQVTSFEYSAYGNNQEVLTCYIWWITGGDWTLHSHVEILDIDNDKNIAYTVCVSSTTEQFAQLLGLATPSLVSEKKKLPMKYKTFEVKGKPGKRERENKSRPKEVPAESRPAVENSDSDFEGVDILRGQIAAVALDKRSKSSERKERKARKTAEKPA